MKQPTKVKKIHAVLEYNEVNENKIIKVFSNREDAERVRNRYTAKKSALLNVTYHIVTKKLDR